MTNMPIENLSEETISINDKDIITEENNSYGYNDNLTAKLGGNYNKIIEFYENRL